MSCGLHLCLCVGVSFSLSVLVRSGTFQLFLNYSAVAAAAAVDATMLQGTLAAQSTVPNSMSCKGCLFLFWRAIDASHGYEDATACSTLAR